MDYGFLDSFEDSKTWYGKCLKFIM